MNKMSREERHLQDTFYWLVMTDQEEVYQSQIEVE